MKVNCTDVIRGISAEPHGTVVVTSAGGQLILTPDKITLSGPYAEDAMERLSENLHRFQLPGVNKSLAINPDAQTLDLVGRQNGREVVRHHLGQLESFLLDDPTFQQVLDDANISLC